MTTVAVNTGLPIQTHAAPSKSTLLSDENYKFLQQEIYRDSGIVLDGDKHYLLDARLTPLVREAKLASLDDLCARLRARTSLSLGRQVMEALTTNETLFFRDMAPFEALRTLLLPELLKTPPVAGRPLRIWSAAASSGQEAYSIAMILQEMGLQARAVVPPVQILGTDISEQILSVAREAKYVQFEVNRGLPAMYLVKYFNRIGGDWQLKDEIRSMATFRPFDLRQPMAGLGRFHIIFCRNVLIYFDVETKTKILRQIATVLEPGGYLVLGGAESIMSLQDCYERVPNANTAIYRRKSSA
jgi:chemotaxis protein methyltransferase CheR